MLAAGAGCGLFEFYLLLLVLSILLVLFFLPLSLGDGSIFTEIQSNFNGSNTIWTMKISSVQG